MHHIVQMYDYDCYIIELLTQLFNYSRVKKLSNSQLFIWFFLVNVEVSNFWHLILICIYCSLRKNIYSTTFQLTHQWKLCNKIVCFIFFLAHFRMVKNLLFLGWYFYPSHTCSDSEKISWVCTPFFAIKKLCQTRGRWIVWTPGPVEHACVRRGRRPSSRICPPDSCLGGSRKLEGTEAPRRRTVSDHSECTVAGSGY
jgi:hypothetical protein